MRRPDREITEYSRYVYINVVRCFFFKLTKAFMMMYMLFSVRS
jgi:hypothetical protein